MHVLPDDTGSSAVWAAQRLDDDHIAVVANKFTIRNIDLHDGGERFLYSANVLSVAFRAGLINDTTRRHIDFSAVYGLDADEPTGIIDRRTWRVFDLAAPSLRLAANGAAPYPFSVRVDFPLSLRAILSMTRDHFEGSEFDLTVGMAAGPFG